MVEEKKSIGEKTKEKVSEFFLHLMAYGGFTFKEGVVYMWGDPYIFIPIESFYDLQKNMESSLGTDALDILYWCGKLTGRNATVAMIKRYGLNVKNLPEFVNGATQDGFGYFKIIDKQIEKKPMSGHLISNNCSVSEIYMKKKLKSSKPVDSYICGLLSGGTEPLFNVTVKGKETKCRGKGDKECIFELISDEKKESFKFFKKTKTNLETLENRALKLYLSRKQPSSIFSKKEFPVKFGDGEFYNNGVKGVVIASYLIVILNKLLKEMLTSKRYDNLIDSYCKSCINCVKSKINNSKKGDMMNLKNNIKVLNMFGFGTFNVKYIQKNIIFIENINNSYPKDYVYLFGKSKEPVDIIPQLIIKYFFEYYTGKKVEIKESKCISQGSKSCVYEVIIK